MARAQREGQMRRLRRESEDLARKPRKGPADEARAASVNAQLDEDVRASTRDEK
jgi:hypothetical protein